MGNPCDIYVIVCLARAVQRQFKLHLFECLNIDKLVNYCPFQAGVGGGYWEFCILHRPFHKFKFNFKIYFFDGVYTKQITLAMNSFLPTQRYFWILELYFIMTPSFGIIDILSVFKLLEFFYEILTQVRSYNKQWLCISLD